MLILLNGFFVAGEFALVAVNRSRVEGRAATGDRSAARVLTSLRRLSFELSGAQLGITATSLVIGAVAEPTLAAELEPLLGRVGLTSSGAAITLALVLATGAQMVLGELFPKNVAIARPYAAARYVAIPMQMVNALLRPLILFLNAAANWTVRRLGIEPLEELAGVRSMEELELIIRSSGAEGELDEAEISLLTRAISFGEKVAADAMVPRVAVVGIAGGDTVARLRELALQTGHSRFPVYGEDLDEVLGTVHVKDSYRVAADRRHDTAVADLAKPALTVPDSRPLDELLVDLQTQGRGMAVVVDEYGGTAGIVTVEDLLEEIFGAIEDEHDAPAPPAPPEGPGRQELSGLLHRHEVEEQTGFQWPEGRYETLGGFLTATLGRFPLEGEVIVVDGWTFQVAAMDGHRVDRVTVRPPTREARR